ncbi:MAG: PD-(D/E)XK nuclease family protein [Gammaproteobacteria bacterium]|nr:PD-(D/E)XK nuclease family protein [Gammaproteobacteria bacterium]MBU1647525.1 PD-(D/E)XK nuclease family protein [Gammaproteobacteria bacterium]MBU1972974.1 PD-(D/E)XK nuclease family protein [Gammaproteobacteria bacterium]
MPEIVHGLAALESIAGPVPILCATHRLTRRLRLAHGRAQLAAGRERWPALESATVAQWCGTLLGEALLGGELPAELAPQLVLSAAQERVLWERILEADADTNAGDDFYDRAGLATAAAEANALIEAWKLPLPDGAGNEETRRFLAWREEFRRRCHPQRWLEAVRGLDWQIDAIARGAGRLPPAIAFAGFDRLPPQEARLARVLAERGVRVLELRLEMEQEGESVALALPDRLAECRAAANWAARMLEQSPAARLGIVVPELGDVRERLADMLDEALQPAALAPARAESPRRHDFSLGTPLARQPLVQVALELIGLASGRGRVEQARVGELMRGVYWSAGDETDARHRLEARMREKLAPDITLERLIRFVRRAAEREDGRAIAAPRLLCQLEAMQAWRPAARQLPSRWAAAFAELLAAAGWPGDRSLSSHEWQARRAFLETLDGLGQLDALLGKVGAGDTARQLRQLCSERIFQPEAGGRAQVEVMGLLEAAAEPMDGLWVMGMNEHAWPPQPRPNPLLPAELQRRAGTPNASAEVQLAFARKLQQRLLRTAPRVVFSHAQGEGGRALRPSPLLAGMAVVEADGVVIDLLAGLAGSATLEQLDDNRAPAVGPGEKVSGGTGLLRAQAICPAWAFYQYRLGVRALDEPVEGLDAMGRGTLLHAVLERFWAGRGSSELLAMDSAQRAAAIAAAVSAGIADFDAAREEPLPPRFLALEAERLQRLVAQWLEVEAGRPAAFRVVACEREIVLEIEGIAVRMVIDRIDELEDGRLLILDYKTGKVSAASWNDARITEPQLPIYASLVTGGELGAEDAADVCAAAFARVRLDDCGFAGIAAAGGLLPRVDGIGDDKARKLFPAVASWPELLAHWRASIAAIAREVGEGDAAVRFADEKDLAYCDVRPLLRLAERRRQLDADGGEP